MKYCCRASAFLLLVFAIFPALGQSFGNYTAENAHSHNDYKQLHPFYEAYNAGFGSMEADIFLRNGLLLAAHNENEINDDRSLETLYLKPLGEKIRQNGGTPYADHNKQLQLLIELKESPAAELDALKDLFGKYPEIYKNEKISIVFTGITPPDSVILNTPDYMYFDFVPGRFVNKKVLKKVAMFSDDFHRYSRWNGIGTIPQKDFDTLQAVVNKYHRLHKKVRFWDTPDNPDTWRLMEQLQADYINTDKIRLLANYLNNPTK